MRNIWTSENTTQAKLIWNNTDKVLEHLLVILSSVWIKFALSYHWLVPGAIASGRCWSFCLHNNGCVSMYHNGELSSLFRRVVRSCRVVDRALCVFSVLLFFQCCYCFCSLLFWLCRLKCRENLDLWIL